MRGHRLFVLSCMLCLVAGITGTGFARPSSVRAGTNTITIQITGVTHPSGFLPALLSVHVNDTVVFLNDATPAATYSVVANDQSFASPPIAPGQQWSTTFTTPGVHDYTDPAYSEQMFGELVVVEASVQLLPTPQPGAVETAIAQDQSPSAPAGTTSTPPQAQSFPLAVILGGLGGLLLVLGIVLVLLIRSRRRKKAATPVAKHP